MRLKQQFLPPLMVLFLLMFAGTGALAQDIEINATNFPDENFRNWLLQQEYGADGILTIDEIKAVKQMHIEGQNIKSLEGIHNFYNLQDLRCDNNQLTSLEIKGLPDLELLKCANNMLASLRIRSARNLVIIECQNNQLTSFIIEGSCPDLINVECYQNQLKASAMDDFLNSLAECKGKGKLRIIYTDDLHQEGNILSLRQRGLISGWDILDNHGNSYFGGYPSERVTIGSSGYTTWVTKMGDNETRYHNSDCIEFATVDGITAYIVTAATPAGVKLEPIKKAIENTPVILNGPEGEHQFTESLTFGGVNDDYTKLKAKGAVGDGRTIYKLDSGSQGVGFYLVPSGEEVEHYLVIEQTAGSAPEFIPMGTDIDDAPDDGNGDDNGDDDNGGGDDNNGDDTTVCIGELYYNLDTASNTATVVAIPTTKPGIGKSYSLSTVTIPDVVDYDGVTYSVTGIDGGTFIMCSSLTSVTIGKNVERIGADAFAMCDNLETVVCFALTPPECGGASVFAPLIEFKALPLYVPAESRAAYQAADVWKDFTIVSELSVTVGSTGYATYCGMVDLDFTGVADGVKAYVASSYDDGSVTLMPVTNVPAGTGLLLIGAAGVYDVPFVVTEEVYDDNLLVGTLEAQPLPRTEEGYTNYVLGRKGTEVAFFLPKEGETIAAYKAYLRLPTDVPSGVRMIIGDGTTAVGLPTGQVSDDAAVYSLTGQRVSTPQRGLYIVGGRKVIVK